MQNADDPTVAMLLTASSHSQKSHQISSAHINIFFFSRFKTDLFDFEEEKKKQEKSRWSFV